MKPDSADRRTLREKLLDVAKDPGASEGERNNARSLLEKLTATRANLETPRPITREAVFTQPDDFRGRGRGVRVRYPSGVWATMDEADVDWEMVEAHHLRYRFDGDTRDRQAGYGRKRSAQCAHCNRWYPESEIIAHVWAVHISPFD